MTLAEVQELLSELELDTVSLRDVYRKGCDAWGRRVNSSVVAALPASLGAYEIVDRLDFSSCYIGASGFVALLPVVVCCERLRSLSVRAVGLKRDGALALCEAAAAHPSLSELDVSGNELGTTAGAALLRLCEDNARISKIEAADALLIDSIRRRIARRCDRNRSIEPPTRVFKYIPRRREGGEEPSEEELAAARVEAEKKEEERRKILDRLPHWMPAACKEFCETLHVHAHHMRDVISLFAPAPETPDACPPSEFRRVLGMLGCRFAAAEQRDEADEGAPEEVPSDVARPKDTREVAFARFLSCYRGGLIFFEELTAVFRTHAVITANREWPGDGERTAVRQAMLDAVYDSRVSLREACEALAAGEPAVVSRAELLAGLAALQVRGACGEVSREQKAVCAEELLAAAGIGPDCDVCSCDDFLSGIAAGEQPQQQWQRLTAAAIRELRARAGHEPPDGRTAPAARRAQVGDRVKLAPQPERSPWGRDPRHWGILMGGAEGTVISDDGSDCVPLRVQRDGRTDLFNAADLVVVSRPPADPGLQPP